MVSAQKENKLAPVTYCEIDLKAIRHNVKALRHFAASRKLHNISRPSTLQLLAVIKADAYGHGMEPIGHLLDELGIDFFGVSDVFEGMRLRAAGLKKPILLFETTLAAQAQHIVDYQLMPTVCTLDVAQALNRYAQQKKQSLKVHVKVDTGMGRLGVWYKDAITFVQKIMALKYLVIQGVFTHFPVADTDCAFTEKQIKQLTTLVQQLDQKGLVIPYVHAANSMGLTGYQVDVLNLSRPGLTIYGLYPDSKIKTKINLKPAMSIRSTVIFCKDVLKGQGISYGHSFTAKKKMKVAVVPIGYSDGYLRIFSNKADVLVGGQRCPVIGRVTMDQVMVDVSKVKNTRIGMAVTILGTQKQECITAEELADHAQTINYEIVCSLGSRLPRIYKS